jgi:hypothetical protein
VNWYPRGGSNFWVRRVHPFYFARRGHDEVQRGSEDVLNGGVRFNFTRQGFLSAAYGRGHEPWLGRRFRTGGGIDISGNVQILRWLDLNAGFNNGRQIYYDLVDPFQGRSRGINFGTTLQPNEHLSQTIGFNSVRFNRESTGEQMFNVDILNLKTTYQFNKHFLVRLLEQFDSSANRLLSDLLASYEFVPGTVFHAGYGSLYEKREVEAGALVPNSTTGNYLTVNRGLFFKASYLHRF